jgi:hypothetical protein
VDPCGCLLIWRFGQKKKLFCGSQQKEQENPSLSNHDFQDVDYDRPFHAVNFNLPESTNPQTVFIGVYGDPIMVPNQSKRFSLVAWSPQ